MWQKSFCKDRIGVTLQVGSREQMARVFVLCACEGSAGTMHSGSPAAHREAQPGGRQLRTQAVPAAEQTDAVDAKPLWAKAARAWRSESPQPQSNFHFSTICPELRVIPQALRQASASGILSLSNPGSRSAPQFDVFFSTSDPLNSRSFLEVPRTGIPGWALGVGI